MKEVILDQYSVRFGSLTDIAPVQAWQNKYSGLFLITDTNTHQYCAPLFIQKTGLPAGVPTVTIPAGEQHKHLRTCEQIWQAMLDHKLDRKALVINLGGGVIGDMGGFCAATFKRGVDFVQVPTTLLSATDASVGGKLGIDFQAVKNIIGVFHDPQTVLIDVDFLHTLPDRELLSGFAEVIKHACIAQDFRWSQVTDVQSLRQVDWAAVLPDSVDVKAQVVRQDPKEKGLRAVLNFGHTIGHAVESYFLNTATPLTHGEAIAMGMIWEGRLAEEKGLNMGVSMNQLEPVIRTHFPDIAVESSMLPDIWKIMLQDKKNTRNQVRAVVPGDMPFSMTEILLNQQDLEIILHQS